MGQSHGNLSLPTPRTCTSAIARDRTELIAFVQSLHQIQIHTLHTRNSSGQPIQGLLGISGCPIASCSKCRGLNIVHLIFWLFNRQPANTSSPVLSSATSIESVSDLLCLSAQLHDSLKDYPWQGTVMNTGFKAVRRNHLLRLPPVHSLSNA